ncbi:MAG: hypothetical protein GFH27_549283n315 [Chloroflexi bacterium AL-W]|nr:hypothetical protein [Chloroflexi bacterium AL-N1]NOK64563.1 hypothetical protein [Chloroflexi bacterium AL-N10]NOK75805.1 hypothetical protein [Chloroflexi bacterium AL-N5]NOK80436.1 hypothetical protein [Chloroflexi bacterium AL-W]NOK86950.1 hypothetical protein [Chloroflexi bacterium AL-N15]
MNQTEKTYLREFGIAMVAYTVVLVGVLTLLPFLAASPWRFLLVLVPIIPIGYGIRSFVRYLDGLDELQRRIQLAGVTFAAAITGLLTFSYGLLEIVGLPSLSWVWVLPILILSWGLGVALARQKYQ